MDAAVAGVVGVVVGALVTGGLQAFGALLTRRLHARVAARLLHVTLSEAAAALRVVIDRQWWGPALDDWNRLLNPWAEQREPLARVLSTDDFVVVASTFSMLERLNAYREAELRGLENPDDKPEDQDFNEQAVTALGALDAVIEAGEVIWRAGYPLLRPPKRPSPLRARFGIPKIGEDEESPAKQV